MHLRGNQNDTRSTSGRLLAEDSAERWQKVAEFVQSCVVSMNNAKLGPGREPGSVGSI